MVVDQQATENPSEQEENESELQIDTGLGDASIDTNTPPDDKSPAKETSRPDEIVQSNEPESTVIMQTDAPDEGRDS